MTNEKHLSDYERTAERADLAEMQRLNNEIDERENRKRILAERIAARYQAVPHADIALFNFSEQEPRFENPLQQHGYDYLRKTIRSRTKPIVQYAESQGYSLGASKKPGVQVSIAFKKRPDIFGYDNEEWFLLPPWGQEQKETGA